MVDSAAHGQLTPTFGAQHVRIFYDINRVTDPTYTMQISVFSLKHIIANIFTFFFTLLWGKMYPPSPKQLC